MVDMRLNVREYEVTYPSSELLFLNEQKNIFVRCDDVICAVVVVWCGVVWCGGGNGVAWYGVIVP